MPDIDWTDPLADEGDDPAVGVDFAVDPLADDAAGEPDIVASAQQEAGDIGDLALGAIDGLTLNYGDELGSIGTGIGEALGLVPGRDPNAVYADDGNLNLFDDAKQTTAGKAGNLAGNVTTGVGVGLATGGLGGIATQAGIGAGMGGLAGYGEAHDPLQALLSAGTGGILGAGGRALGNAMTSAKPAASSMLNNADAAMTQAPLPADAIPLPAMDDALPLVPNAAPGTSQRMFAPPARKVIDSAGDDGWAGIMAQAGDLALKGSPSVLNPKYAIGKILQAAGKGDASVLRPSPSAIKSMLNGVSGGLNAGTAGGDIGKASGQAVARPDVPTLTWAMQSVNAGGTTGLPQDAQQRLDEALMSGDDSKVSSLYMQFSMKYPAFQKRMQTELEAVNEGN